MGSRIILASNEAKGRAEGSHLLGMEETKEAVQEEWDKQD